MEKPRDKQPLKTVRNAAQQLKQASLLPARQRIAIAVCLLGRGKRQHFTAEAPHQTLMRKNASPSLATVCNTLKAFEKNSLIKKIDIRSESAIYDTNTETHDHLVLGKNSEIQDMPLDAIHVGTLPQLPQGLIRPALCGSTRLDQLGVLLFGNLKPAWNPLVCRCAKAKAHLRRWLGRQGFGGAHVDARPPLICIEARNRCLSGSFRN